MQEYYLEDCIQMTNFVPPPSDKKRKRNNDDDDGDAGMEVDGEDDGAAADLSKVCSNDYSQQTKTAMAKLGEKEMSFELIESLLHYIKSLQVPGAVLVFLPGWSLIFALMKHLQQHQLFGGQQYRIIPLHSQLPREDQRMVFHHVPDGVTKVQQ